MDSGELVARAASGDHSAWELLVARYERLVWSVARGHRLDDSDAADVFQTTWMRLLEHLDDLRNPAAVSGWLATTARNECLRMLRHHAREVPTGDDQLPEQPVTAQVDEALLTEERDRLLWEAFASISARCQALLRMLTTDPPPSYEDVSLALDMPIGSIGPTRGRCLEALRRSAAGARITG